VRDDDLLALAVRVATGAADLVRRAVAEGEA